MSRRFFNCKLIEGRFVWRACSPVAAHGRRLLGRSCAHDRLAATTLADGGGLTFDCLFIKIPALDRRTTDDQSCSVPKDVVLKPKLFFVLISGAGTSGGELEEESWQPPDPELTQKLIAQIEYYLSDENLEHDAFLLKHVRRNKLGFVSVKLLTSFKKVGCEHGSALGIFYCIREN